MSIYPSPREDLTDDEEALLRRAGWEPSPIGGGWWRDPQTGQDRTTERAVELARRDLGVRP